MKLIWQGKRGQEAVWGREGIAEEPAAPEMLQKATITASQEGIKITRGKVMWHRDRIKSQVVQNLMVKVKEEPKCWRYEKGTLQDSVGMGAEVFLVRRVGNMGKERGEGCCNTYRNKVLNA